MAPGPRGSPARARPSRSRGAGPWGAGARPALRKGRLQETPIPRRPSVPLKVCSPNPSPRAPRRGKRGILGGSSAGRRGALLSLGNDGAQAERGPRRQPGRPLGSPRRPRAPARPCAAVLPPHALPGDCRPGGRTHRLISWFSDFQEAHWVGWESLHLDFETTLGSKQI